MKAITLLGMGPSALVRQAHIELDVVGEVWGLNQDHYDYKLEYSRYFYLHHYDDIKEVGVEDNAPACDFHALNELGCPVYTTEPYPIVENQVRYPLKDVFKHFNCNYFKGSPSLMLALALYEHDMGDELSEIRSWGFDFMDERHKQQKASWAFWISKAQDRNIICTGSSLDFMQEQDNDVGLRGLDLRIREEVMADYEDKATGE